MANASGVGLNLTPPEGDGAVLNCMYRYLLWRTWDETRPRLLWVMLNPSLADCQRPDPTLRLCINFSDRWGYGSLEIVNLFALITPYPNRLYEKPYPIAVGSFTDEYIKAAAKRADRIVAAWGGLRKYSQRVPEVLELLTVYGPKPFDLGCLSITQGGHPHHPRGLKRDTQLMRYTSDERLSRSSEV